MAKNFIFDWINKNHKAFDDLALEIWKNPELPFEEHEAARLQMDFMKRQGFTVSQKEGLPTAFVAEWGKGGPAIGILGEFDALVGLSQAVSTRIEPLKEGGPGHGCGHNLLGVAGMLAACAVKEALASEGREGRVRYFGCPGEEQLTGKSKMAKLNYFDGTDLSLAWHPGDYSSVTDATMTALFSVKFKFKGRASHAGASPEAGRSALDAVELMNVGANYLREHMLDQNRLHYVITDGGPSPNIVPPRAEVWYYARAPHDAELVHLWTRLLKVARGAAMMTETEVSYELLGGCYNTLPNKVLNEVLEANLMEFAGPIEYTDEERRFAEEMQKTLTPDQAAATKAKLFFLKDDEKILAHRPFPCFDHGGFIMGSSDVGDVANLMPTSMAWGATWPVGIPIHSWQSTAFAGSSIGLKGGVQAAKAMAGAIYDLMNDPAKIEAAKQEFEKRRDGRPYQPIDELLIKADPEATA